MSKDLDRLVAELRSQGFNVRRTPSNRLVVSKDGKMIVTISMRSGDSRAAINNLSRLTRAGFKA